MIPNLLWMGMERLFWRDIVLSGIRFAGVGSIVCDLAFARDSVVGALCGSLADK